MVMVASLYDVVECVTAFSSLALTGLAVVTYIEKTAISALGECGGASPSANRPYGVVVVDHSGLRGRRCIASSQSRRQARLLPAILKTAELGPEELYRFCGPRSAVCQRRLCDCWLPSSNLEPPSRRRR